MNKKNIIPWNPKQSSKRKWLKFAMALMTTAGLLASNLNTAQNTTNSNMNKQKKATTSSINNASKNTLQSSEMILVEDTLNHTQIIHDFCERIIYIYGQKKAIDIIRYHMFQEINNIRKQYGLSQLQQNPILNSTAQNYAKYMFENNRYKHDSKEWISFEQRLENAWYSSDLMGENIDRSYTNIYNTIHDRLLEPKHREIFLHKDINEIGIGFYGGEMIRGNFSERIGFFVMDVGKK